VSKTARSPRPEATIVGAGSVGLALAARLAHAGVAVLLVTRREDAARALAARGLAAEDPATGARVGVGLRATADPAWPAQAAGPVFVCTRADAVEAVAHAFGDLASPFVTFQNDVASEAVAARHVRLVIGGVWRETATRRADDRVSLQLARPGRAVVGLHPRGRSAAVEDVAALLRRGGVDASVSEAIERDKWLKLCINLMSTPNALVRRPDHTTAAFADVKVRLLEEAEAVLAAAGIDATPCDGRDRTLAEEIVFQREALARGKSARPLPLYNHVWTALRSGAPLEADAYHERILALAEQHGLAAPVNRLVLEKLREAARTALGPECCEARELLPG
jgi:2-dehydropantoate 2-reductase